MGKAMGTMLRQLCEGSGAKSSDGHAASPSRAEEKRPTWASSSEERSDAKKPTWVGKQRSTFLDCKVFFREQDGRASDYFRKVGDLGEGAFGDVWLGRERVNAGTAGESEGRLVAVKRVRKPCPGVGLDEESADSKEAEEDMRTEVDLMKSLDHPTICRLLQVLEDSHNLYIVMEHIDGCELFDRILDLGSFSEGDAADVTHQVASALRYCHDKGVVHRDVKTENIMVVDLDDTPKGICPGVTVKLIDFGFGCRILEGVKLKPKVGSYVYCAPEVIQLLPCDEKQDMWSLGCTLFILLSGEAPFGGPNVKQQIVAGEYAIDGEAWNGIESHALDLVKGLLTIDPEKRLSATAVLAHPWFTLDHRSRSRTSDAKVRHIDSLKAFRKESLFQHVVAGVVARQLDETMLHQLHCEFSAIDADDDGIISMAEFRQACKEIGPEGHAIFNAVDMDGSGYVDYTEFVAACMDRRIEDQEGVCWSAFQVFDKDGDGYVDYAELREVMDNANVSNNFTKGVLKKLWEKLLGEQIDDDDQSPKGRVSFDKFLAAMHEARAEEASEAGRANMSRAKSSPGPGLPISSRNQGAVAAMGLPIASRASAPPPTGSTADAPLLPMLPTRSAPALQRKQQIVTQ